MEKDLQKKLGEEQRLDDLIDQDDLKPKKTKSAKKIVKRDLSDSEEEAPRPKR